MKEQEALEKLCGDLETVRVSIVRLDPILNSSLRHDQFRDKLERWVYYLNPGTGYGSGRRR